jgi:hypothetical protein
MFCLNNWEVQTKFYYIVVMIVGEKESWVLFNIANFSTVLIKNTTWRKFLASKDFTGIQLKPLTVTTIPYVFLTSPTFMS